VKASDSDPGRPGKASFGERSWKARKAQEGRQFSRETSRFSRSSRLWRAAAYRALGGSPHGRRGCREAQPKETAGAILWGTEALREEALWRQCHGEKGESPGGWKPRRAPGLSKSVETPRMANGFSHGVRPWRRLWLLETAVGVTTRGQGPLEGGTAVWEGKALEGEPHECLSGETNRQGAARSKPSGGRETLKTARQRGWMLSCRRVARKCGELVKDSRCWWCCRGTEPHERSYPGSGWRMGVAAVLRCSRRWSGGSWSHCAEAEVAELGKLWRGAKPESGSTFLFIQKGDPLVERPHGPGRALAELRSKRER